MRLKEFWREAEGEVSQNSGPEKGHGVHRATYVRQIVIFKNGRDYLLIFPDLQIKFHIHSNFVQLEENFGGLKVKLMSHSFEICLAWPCSSC